MIVAEMTDSLFFGWPRQLAIGVAQPWETSAACNTDQNPLLVNFFCSFRPTQSAGLNVLSRVT